MAKLVEGNLVFTAVPDTAALASEQNDYQGQVRDMVKAQEIGLTHLGFPDASAWSYNFSTALWEHDGAGGGERLFFPLPFRAGQKLTEVHAAVEVVTKGTVGDLKLFWRSKTPSAGSMPGYGNTTLISNVWNVASDNYATLQSATALTVVILGGYNYFLDFTPRTGVVCKIHEVTAKAQFGN
jgi:hypothetical protein